MKKIRKLVATAAVFIFAMSAVGCNMIEKTPEAIAKTVVAKVGDKKITRKDIDTYPEIANAIKQLKEQYGENFAQGSEIREKLKEAKLQVLNNLIWQQEIISEAEKLNVVPKDNELEKLCNGEIDKIKKQQNIKDDKELEEKLKLQGGNINEFKDMVRKKIILDKLIDKVTQDVKVDDKELKDYYNKTKDNYPKDPKKPTTVHLAHILVPDEQQAKSIKSQIDKGVSFQELAKKYGTDGTKLKGGDLGTVPVVNSGFDEDFMNGALQLKDGQVSEPIKTQFGYHIIKMIKKQVQPVKTFEEVKNQVKSTLIDTKKKEAWTKKSKEIRKGAKVKVYEDKLV